MLKFQAETGKMTPLETQAFIEDVFVIRDTFVNFFLIKSDEYYIAIDAGNDVEHIRGELDQLNIGEKKVLAVFLTQRIDNIASGADE